MIRLNFVGNEFFQAPSWGDFLFLSLSLSLSLTVSFILAIFPGDWIGNDGALEGGMGGEGVWGRGGGAKPEFYRRRFRSSDGLDGLATRLFMQPAIWDGGDRFLAGQRPSPGVAIANVPTLGTADICRLTARIASIGQRYQMADTIRLRRAPRSFLFSFVVCLFFYFSLSFVLATIR